ncbi:hypothetical protein SNE40_010221 [Patella caerulea]|uniref:Zinc finger PHD-type domain-containing protein n=1 Tax=Patella caerulea TaxID=87958 RepID=A0AAN8JQ48_PATCE
MKPLSTFYTKAVESWLRNNPGRTVTIYQVAALFGKAYLKSATSMNASSGFRKTGIYPTDRDIFEDCEFAASFVTDKPLPTGQTPEDTPSTTTTERPIVKPHEPIGATTIFVLPEDISPPPKVSSGENIPKKRKSNAGTGSSRVLTASPYLNHLFKLHEAKIKKVQKTSTSVKQKKATRPISRESKCSKTSLDDTENNECLYCTERYGMNDFDGWIQCMKCQNWAHDECAGVDDSDDTFICEFRL